MQAAARITDPIEHTSALSGLLTGLLIGAAIAVAAIAIVGTGGLAAVAIVGAGAAMGAGVGEMVGSMSFAKSVSGAILQSGSSNTNINSLKAARAHVDVVECSKHPNPPKPIATGSSNVFINSMPAARVGDKTGCDAEISSGSQNVFIGGGTVQTDEISPEVPGWLHVAVFAVGMASAVVLAGPVIAFAGLVGGVLGGAGGNWLGGKLFGEGSDGQKASAFVGAMIGGIVGGKGGALLTAKSVPIPASTADLIAQRVSANALLRDSPQFAADMNKVGVTDEQIGTMFAKEAPLGFESPEQFGQFKTDLHGALNEAGLPDAEIGLKGTSTTFYSENPGKPLGHHWDADPLNPGDYDLNISSPKMVEQLQDANISPSEKYGVFKTRDINENFPALDKFQQEWSQKLGRDVNFVGYPETPLRDPTEYILRTPE
ncbi:Rhs-family protein [Collimonas arenae]|uniref:Rhs-family protein n=1 Tax=Collimonas arenae TaxID=279058 RepID=A0A0A1FHB4_9BURK|nr:PAAR domain-containing protein [Collimonas arenae]AIY43034.1 Rhs-family protein [Collimonas arenae]